jgi:hypothetical protein
MGFGIVKVYARDRDEGVWREILSNVLQCQRLGVLKSVGECKRIKLSVKMKFISNGTRFFIFLLRRIVDIDLTCRFTSQLTSFILATNGVACFNIHVFSSRTPTPAGPVFSSR